MKTVKYNHQRAVILPRSMFKPTDKIVTFCEKDMFIVKKLSLPDVTEIASKAKGKAIPLREIVKEVHRYRKEKRTA